MYLIIAEDSASLDRLAADFVERRVTENPQLCLGTVTGASPEGMYRELARRHAKNGLDFSEIRTINTDEYLGLSAIHPQSYHFYLEQKFFCPCGIPLCKADLRAVRASITRTGFAKFQLPPRCPCGSTTQGSIARRARFHHTKRLYLYLLYP